MIIVFPATTTLSRRVGGRVERIMRVIGAYACMEIFGTDRTSDDNLSITLIQDYHRKIR